MSWPPTHVNVYFIYLIKTLCYNKVSIVDDFGQKSNPRSDVVKIVPVEYLGKWFVNLAASHTVKASNREANGKVQHHNIIEDRANDWLYHPGF